MAFSLQLEHKYPHQDNPSLFRSMPDTASLLPVGNANTSEVLNCLFLQGRPLRFPPNDPKRRVRAAPAGGLTEDRNDPFRQNHGGSPSGVSAFGQPPVRAFGEARRA
jgi:hypothetical protein